MNIGYYNTENVVGEVQVQENLSTSAKKNSDDYFVRIPVDMFDEKNISGDGVLLFHEICFHGNCRNPYVTYITVDMLSQVSGLTVKVVIEKIIELSNEGFITFQTDDSELKKNTFLTIHTPKGMTKAYDGFQELHKSTVDRVKESSIKKKGQTLKALVYIMWRKNIEYKISYKEWAYVLGISERTANTFIKELVDEGLISKIRGDYYTTETGEIRQEMNSYVVKDEKKIFKSNITQDHKRNLSVADLLVECTDERINPDNCRLFIYGSDLTVEDMYIYKTTKCPLVLKWGKKRYEAISTTKGGKKLVTQWENEVKQILLEQKTIEFDEYVYVDEDEDGELALADHYEIKKSKKEDEQPKQTEYNDRFLALMDRLKARDSDDNDNYEEAM